MSPSIAIIIASILQGALKILEREFSKDEHEQVKEGGEQLAAMFIDKESESA